MEYLSEIFIGLPVAPNFGTGFLYSKKDKMADGSPRRRCVSDSHFNGANFCWEEKGQWQSISDEHNIIAWSYWSYIRAESLSKYSIR